MIYSKLSYLTWILFLLASVFWFFTLLFVARKLFKKFEWRYIFFSFFGFAWLGFFTNFILRFLLINLDPVTFQATAFPLWNIHDLTYTYSWGLILIFWFIFSITYFFFIKNVWVLVKRLIKNIEIEPTRKSVLFLDILVLISLVFILINSGLLLSEVPRAFFTVFGYLGGIYLISATYMWLWKFAGKMNNIRRFTYLVPGILYYVTNPYRENILLALLPVLIPYLFFKKRINLSKLAIVFMIFLFSITVLNYAYRNFLWGETGTSSTINVERWENNPATTPWVTTLNRFHGFDSFILTVYTVPSVYPYTDRNVFLELIKQTLVPTAFGKEFKSDIGTKRGTEFAESIWSYGGEGTISARIAPSMPGDLYRANGITMIIVGAFLWGMIVGLLENLRYGLSSQAFIVLLVIFGLRVFGAIERDFVFASANILQLLIVIILLFLLFSGKKDKSTR